MKILINRQILFRIIPLLLLVCCSVGFSIYAALYISEHFFFDKFYYYKSTKHGYWIPNKPIQLSDFGSRSEDIEKLITSTYENSSVLGSTDTDVFTVAVIGDSYVWGQGVIESDRFARQLEKRLQSILPSQVLIYGNSGDSILDNYIKLTIAQKLHSKIDLVIIGLVDNDMLFKEKNYYNDELSKQLLQHCPGDIIYEPTYKAFTDNSEYGINLLKSYDETNANICITKNVLSLFPKQQILFYNFDDFFYSEKELSILSNLISQAGLEVVSTKSIHANYSNHPLSDFFVSSLDMHPSVLAHTMYAEQLLSVIREKGYLD